MLGVGRLLFSSTIDFGLWRQMSKLSCCEVFLNVILASSRFYSCRHQMKNLFSWSPVTLLPSMISTQSNDGWVNFNAISFSLIQNHHFTCLSRNHKRKRKTNVWVNSSQISLIDLKTTYTVPKCTFRHKFRESMPPNCRSSKSVGSGLLPLNVFLEKRQRRWERFDLSLTSFSASLTARMTSPA